MPQIFEHESNESHESVSQTLDFRLILNRIFDRFLAAGHPISCRSGSPPCFLLLALPPFKEGRGGSWVGEDLGSSECVPVCPRKPQVLWTLRILRRPSKSPLRGTSPSVMFYTNPRTFAAAPIFISKLLLHPSPYPCASRQVRSAERSERHYPLCPESRTYPNR